MGGEKFGMHEISPGMQLRVKEQPTSPPAAVVTRLSWGRPQKDVPGTRRVPCVSMNINTIWASNLPAPQHPHTSPPFASTSS